MLYIITDPNLIKLHFLSENQSVSISRCICVDSVSKCDQQGTHTQMNMLRRPCTKKSLGL